MGLHISLLAAAARGHKKRHGNSRSVRRLRPVVPNAKAELAYKSGLLALVRHCKKLVGASMAEVKAHWPAPQAADGVPRGMALDGVSDAAAAIRSAARKLGGLDAWAKRMVGIAVELNRDSVDTRLARVIKEAIGVDVSKLLTANGPLLQSMRTATADNIALIKTIPEQYFDRVLKTVSDGWVNGIRWESLVDQIQEDGNITERRAKLIARDQTAKMNSAFNQERQQQVGIEKYEWQTSEDERVRESHADVDGQMFRWDEPGPVAGSVAGEPCHAGFDVNCRCVALPQVDMEELAIGTGYGEQQEEEQAA